MKRNCQSCKYYKDGYCENLELKPCYPQKGCEYFSKVEQESILDKIRAEIDRQEEWLLQAGYTAYNVDIAFDAIKSVVAESEG